MKTKIGIAGGSGDLGNALKNTECEFINGKFDELLQDLPAGSVIYALAENYPKATLELNSGSLEIASQKRIKLFIEYPLSVEGLAFEEPEVIGYERLAVTSDAFENLTRDSILSPCGMFFLPCKVEAAPILVLARFAGYDRLAFGLPDITYPILFHLPGYPNVLIAAGCLSRFRTGRCMPAASYKALWRGLLKWGTGEDIPVDWTPSAGPTYGPNSILPRDSSEDAVSRSIRWFKDNMIFRIDEAMGVIEEKDGVAADTLMGGVFEGYEAGMDHNGRQRSRNWIRCDCCGETAMAMALDASATGNPETRKIAVDICDYVFSKALYHNDPADPMYGFLNFCTGWNVFYGDDSARVIMSALTVRSLFKIDRWDKRILKCALAYFRTAAQTGFRHNALNESSFKGKTWRDYSGDTGFTRLSPHYQGYAWAAYLWVYALTDFTPMLEKARRGLVACIENYPGNLYWTNSLTAEMARMVLPVTFLVRVDDNPEYRRWLKRICDDIISHMDECGAIEDYFGDLKKGAYPPPQSNEAYGTNEASLIQQNGDPATDLLYTANWAYLGLHEAALVLEDAGIDSACDRMTDFFCRIQVSSQDHPYLEGCWMRSFDFKKWEYWGSSADTGWGALCVESGWTNAVICAVMNMRRQKKSLFDLSARDSFKAIAPDIVREMLN